MRPKASTSVSPNEKNKAGCNRYEEENEEVNYKRCNTDIDN